MIFIALQNTYERVECALANKSGILDLVHCDKFNASKDLIITLNALLSKHNVTLEKIQFIAVNQGPGPFTTLRTVIATANGIAFASKIPLIGVDGLHAFFNEYKNPEFPDTVILLNAFAQDVYFAIEQKNNPLETGYQNITLLLNRLNVSPAPQFRFLGNGATLHRTLIEQTLGKRAFFSEPLAMHCSLHQISLDGLAQWNKTQSGSQQLMPLYLKQHSL